MTLYIIAGANGSEKTTFAKKSKGDIDGVIYTPLDSSAGWKNKLLIELKACDYEVK